MLISIQLECSYGIILAIEILAGPAIIVILIGMRAPM
jgi:hypothetical protein